MSDSHPTKEPAEARAVTVAEMTLYEVHVPLAEMAKARMDASPTGLGMAIPAEEPWDYGEFVICRLESDEGVVGWGESFVWLPETAVSAGQVIATVRDSLAHYVLGASPFDTRALAARMNRNVARNEVAKGLLDLACYDLAARSVGRPVYDLLGGRCVDALPLCALIPLGDIDETVAITSFFTNSGTKTIRLKLGTGIRQDREVVEAVREAVGDDIRIRVDYNQAYRPQEAIRAIRAIEEFGIDAAEQPVAIGDLAGLVTVQRSVATPVFTHEGFFALTDLVAQVELGAVGVVGINTERPGGMTAAMAAIDYAVLHGMGVILHNQPLGLASAAMVHLGAARFFDLGHSIEIFGKVMWPTDLLVDGLVYSGGTVQVPTGPGWGVEIDLDALEARTVGEPVRICK